jgi:insulysin
VPLQEVSQTVSFLDLEDVTLVGQKSRGLPEEDIILTERSYNVEKPEVDHKDYRYFELDNKLKVLLIRDPKATMAEASMNVQVGSWHEPKEYPGLAHFTEHMLFQGSKRFPEVGYFDDLVSGTGGYSNAYTEATNTNYYFQVGSGSLVKALNVFSHFFVDPLFNQDAVDREINAINSEYQLDVNGDSWKIMNLFTLLADESHPAGRFTIGNTETLTKEDIVKQLHKFHGEHYSANLMTLVIRSNLDIKKLEGWLLQKSDFQKIPNLKPIKVPYSGGKPLTDNLASLVKFDVDSSTKSVILNYQLPGR